MVTAAKIPLNAARVFGKWELTKTFEWALSSIIALLQEREDAKAVDPMVKVWPLIREYRGTKEGRRKTLSDLVAAKGC